MKRFLLLIVLLVFVFGCRSPEKKEGLNKIKVLSTIAMIDDLVSEIGKDYVEHLVLIKGEVDPHTYELVKGDDEKFSSADIIFYNGLSLEHGYSLRHNLENNSKAISLGDFLLKKSEQNILKIDNQYDPHIWMDISLWSQVIDPIVEGLCKLDSNHADDYVKNGLALKEKLKAADEMAYERLQKIPSEKRFLVTSHNAFHYFVRRYLSDTNEPLNWQRRVAAPEGLAPEADLSANDIQRVLNYIKTHNINVVFTESNVNKDALKKIVSVGNKTGLALRLSKKDLYADAMGRNRSYLDMINHNVETFLSEFEKL